MKVRLNILTQLLLGFGLVATVLGLVAGFLLTQLAKVESSYGDVATRIQPANTDTSDAQVLVHRQISAVRGYMISRSPDLVKEYDEATKLLDAEVESLQSHIIDSEQRQQADLLKQRNQESDPPVAQVFELLQTGKAEEANRIFTQEALPIFADMLKLADGLSVRYERRAAEAVASAQAEAALARTWGMVALGAGVAMALLFGILMARGMSAPIRRAAAMAAELAGGNLRVEKLNNRSQNEVGDLARAFDQMVEALQEVVGGVHASTRAVTESAGMLSDVSAQSSQASTQTANAVQQVAGGATRQAESTTEVMSTINQLREAIAQVAEGSQQSSHEVQRAVETLGRMVAEVERMDTSATENAAAALQASQAAARGAGAVSETVQGMDRIRSAVAQSAERVRSLAKLSEQVGTITDAISGIAEQTNLLALNAAIEAARAGEHGRGFAVVADEVRKLAERAGLSAREITGLVSSIQNGTAEVVSAMETGRSEVESGSRLAANAGETLKQIEVATQRTADEIQRIATAAKATVTSAREVARVFDTIAAVTEENTASAEEMAASSAEVMHSVEEIASVAQENAAAAEEVSASTEEVTASAQEVAEAAAKLQQIAQGLQEQVGRFRL